MEAGRLLARVGRISLRGRLLWLAALVTALVVGGTTYLHTRILQRTVGEEGLNVAGAAALGVAAELAERESLPTGADLEDVLTQFTQVAPLLRGLTVTRLDDGASVIVASAGVAS